MEGDFLLTVILILCLRFQSTPSAWRETVCPFHWLSCYYISIHSLRMEGDNLDCIYYTRYQHFNPLPPHGGRLSHFCTRQVFSCISIHSLRMEGDLFNPTLLHSFSYFNPLPPHGGRPVCRSITVFFCYISIHSLRMEGDSKLAYTSPSNCISIHSLRMEGDVFISSRQYFQEFISIHSLRMEGDRIRNQYN